MTPTADPHASKISPDDPRLKPRLSKARHLRKAPTLIVLFLLTAVVGVSVSAAVEPREKKLRDEVVQLESQRLPSEIMDAPDVVPPQEPATPDAGAHAPIESPRLYDIPSRAKPKPHGTEDVQAQRRRELYFKAMGADPFVETRPLPSVPRDDGAPGEDVPAGHSGPRMPDMAVAMRQAKQALAEFAPSAPSHDVTTASADSNDGYLHARLQRPRSPYEIQAGTIIPAVLQTAINSDLAGPVFAKVRENVYDSITHEHILIPQNSTLVASYDARVVWGQQRVLLCWQRLILPTGDSLQLQCMPGGDLTGAAGLTDEVDEHWWRLAQGAALASLLSAGTAAAGGNTTGYNPTIPQQFARGAASEFGRAGEGVMRRELMVQPTITIRAGWAMNVLVTQDMILEPYPDDADL